MRRREFITLVGGAAATWPLVARAQQMRRIGIVIALSEGDPELKKWLEAFREGLERLGWSERRNVHFDYRFAPAGSRAEQLAKELLALEPDVILAFSTPVAAAFQRETHTVLQLCSLVSPTRSRRVLSAAWRIQRLISPA